MKRETVIIAALGILTLAGCNNNHRSQVRKFKQTAEKTNRSCPTRMNETITLDSTCYNEKDNSVSYFYSVTGELDNATYMNTHSAATAKYFQLRPLTENIYSKFNRIFVCQLWYLKIIPNHTSIFRTRRKSTNQTYYKYANHPLSMLHHLCIFKLVTHKSKKRNRYHL